MNLVLPLFAKPNTVQNMQLPHILQSSFGDFGLSRKIVSIAIPFCFLGGGDLLAQDIIYDTFPGDLVAPSGTTAPTGNPHDLVGRAPGETNDPGGVYVPKMGYGSAQGGWGGSISKNVAWLGADSGVAIPLGDDQPKILIISVDFNLANVKTSPGMSYTGIGLGFWNEDETGPKFYGVVVQQDGKINLQIGMKSNPTVIGQIFPAMGESGVFDWEAWWRLSYKFDTANGVISDVTLVNLENQEKIQYDLTEAASLTKQPLVEANVTYAGFFVQSLIGGTVGYVDNFRVSKVAAKAAGK